jgi:diaminobutyrate-2-oxoglutarate transaminase
MKLARKVTGRSGIFSFMGGFHGMSLGSLAATGNVNKRRGSAIPLNNVIFMPYPVMPSKLTLLSPNETISFIDNVLIDSHSGIERPAAILFETVQAEGGVNVAPPDWIRALKKLCVRHEILMICDDIQAGCGRTGPFLSFERAGIVPDMVTISKSISGYGGPMSLLLIRPDIDVWQPGEHNGTFRGYQLAMVGGTAALELRENIGLMAEVQRKERFIGSFLHSQIKAMDPLVDIRGIGMIWGIDFSQHTVPEVLCQRVSRRCFDLGLIIETAGRNDTVLKLLPSLTIEDELLEQGCTIIKRAIAECLESAAEYSVESLMPSSMEDAQDVPVSARGSRVRYRRAPVFG